MPFSYVRTDLGELSRGDNVYFRYLDGKAVMRVGGVVDQITRKKLVVGNEVRGEAYGVKVSHVRKYLVSKIQCLEVRVNEEETI